MVTVTSGHVFVGDFVSFNINGVAMIGRVLKFFLKDDCTGTFAKIETLIFEQPYYRVGNEVISPVLDILMVVPAPTFIKHTCVDTNVVLPMTTEEYQDYTTPHRLKCLSAGKVVVMVPLILYSDDTSGNRSKQWNKFDSWCLKLAGLPNEVNQQLHHIHHLCSSNKVDSVEMLPPIVDELKILETEGIVAYDAHLNEEVLLVSPVLCITADNPRSSEIMNHLGPSSRMFCRMCMADRAVAPESLGETRTKIRTLSQISLITAQQSTRNKAKMKTRYGVRDTQNALLQLPLDLHRSTPVETLHTVLLGPYKYLVHSLMGRLSTKEKEEVEARLVVFNFSGFEDKLGYNLCRHFRSFVGRDYKALAQVALFVLGPYMTESERIVWLALSKVFRVTYCQKFHLSSRDECRRVCEGFVSSIKEHFPHLQKKVKIHLLLHLIDNMVDFGPTSSFNTERCETFNSLIRARNVYANRLAPSRDIARSFAVMEYMRFLCAGGTLDGTFRCGEDLITLFKTPAIQQFVNGIPARETLSQKHIYQPGTLRKVSTRPSYFYDTDVLVLGSPPNTINQLKINSNVTLLAGPIQANIEIYSAGAVIGSTRRHQLINTGSYVKFSAAPGEVDYGFLSGCIQVPDGECTSLCIVQQLQPMDSFGFQLTNELECPLFQQTHLFRCIPSQCIRTSVSFCHECTSSCKFVRKSTIASFEREPLQVQKLVFQHDFSSDMYCLNVYSISQSY